MMSYGSTQRVNELWNMDYANTCPCDIVSSPAEYIRMPIFTIYMHENTESTMWLT